MESYVEYHTSLAVIAAAPHSRKRPCGPTSRRRRTWDTGLGSIERTGCAPTGSRVQSGRRPTTLQAGRRQWRPRDAYL